MNEYNDRELRCYTFTLYQLSPIQQGIQAGHAAVELGAVAYKRLARDLQSDHFRTYYDWATKWKTMVLLNGGDLHELCELRKFFSHEHNTFPWTTFYESEESLGGILTSIAIILPDRIYGSAENMRKLKPGHTMPKCAFTEWEYELLERLCKTGLAR
jgi:hypothetical protein